MAGFADIATSMLVSAGQRIDATAVNVSNLATPGFRARKIFQRIVDAREFLPVVSTVSSKSEASAVLKMTGNALDITVTGSGYLLLRAGNRMMPAVSVQLHRDADGRLIDAAGRVLQAAGGGDVVVSGDNPVLLKDGTLLVGGQAEVRVGAFAGNAAADGDLSMSFAAGALPEEAEGAVLRQGMIVPSNVDLGTEMVEMTRAARMAETGARVFQVYDDLIGRVASKLGEVGR